MPEKALCDEWYLAGGEWTVERHREMRYQQIGSLREHWLQEFVLGFGSPRVARALGTFLEWHARRAYNPLGEPVTGLARRGSMLARGGYDATLRYWVDVDMWFQLIQNDACVILREALCGFRIHRGAASFTLQGDSYAEFLEIAKRYAPGSAASRRSLAQRVRAGVDSMARLAIYRIFG